MFSENQELKTENWKPKTGLLQFADALAQAALVASCGVAVQDAFAAGFVEHADGTAEGFLGGFLVAGADGVAQFAQVGAQAAAAGAVDGGLLGGLARALQCWKMIGHGPVVCPSSVWSRWTGRASRRRVSRCKSILRESWKTVKQEE